MMRCGAKLIAVALAIATLSMANLYSQLLNNSRNANPQVNCSFRWSVNPNLIQKVSTPIVAGRLISFPVLSGPDPKIATSALHGRRLVQQGNVFPQASAGTRGMLLQQQTSASLLPSAGGVGPGSVQSVTPIGGAFSSNTSPPVQKKGSNFATSHNWITTPNGQNKVLISWQEQSCGKNAFRHMRLTVIGPRGVNPL